MKSAPKTANEKCTTWTSRDLGFRGLGEGFLAPQPDIFVQRMDGEGHPAAQERPFLASGADGYLAVWQDSRDGATSGSDVYGHLLDASGALSGTLIAISTAAGDQSNPAAAYNDRRDEYLVVWDDDRSGTDRDIYGQVVGGDGMLVAGAAFSLTVAGHQGYPDVAYNPGEDSYLAVWEDYRPGASGSDIYGQVISADGSLLGSDFALTSASGYQYDPVVAYGEASGVYLAAWWDRRDNVQYDIFGQASP